jgi:hypothetical protein
LGELCASIFSIKQSQCPGMLCLVGWGNLGELCASIFSIKQSQCRGMLCLSVGDIWGSFVPPSSVSSSHSVLGCYVCRLVKFEEIWGSFVPPSSVSSSHSVLGCYVLSVGEIWRNLGELCASIFSIKQSQCVIQHSIAEDLTVSGHRCNNLRTCAILTDREIQVYE